MFFSAKSGSVEKRELLLKVLGSYWYFASFNASFLTFHYIFRLMRARCCEMWASERKIRQNILEEEEVELPLKRLIANGWETREDILGI